jgi:hypothetical protein
MFKFDHIMNKYKIILTNRMVLKLADGAEEYGKISVMSITLSLYIGFALKKETFSEEKIYVYNQYSFFINIL